MAEKLKACPFCGCEVGLVTDFAYPVVRGDHALTCVFLDEEPVATAEEWNNRDQLPSQGGEAVGVWLQSSNKERYADLLVLGNPDDIYAGAYDTKVPLYTHPAGQVAEPDAELVELLRQTAEQLRRWAVESHQGGWSTHQVKPMRDAALRIDAKLASLEVKP